MKMKMKMKKRIRSSVSVSEGNEYDDSCGVVELDEEKGKGEQTLLPSNPNPNPNIKLGDGFFEIETIRRKRVRKGQLQYLIKWRGWPETANTWEPLQNLHSVPDLVHSFENSLKSAKHSKRMHKHAVHHNLPQKRLQRSTTSYGLRHFPIHNNLPSHPQTHISADQGQTNTDPTTLPPLNLANVNGFAKHKQSEYDPKLSELKATTNAGVEADMLAIYFPLPKVSTGNSHMDSQSMVECMEPVQIGYCRGAKRRKSGYVKRFNKGTYASEPIDAQNAINMSVATGEVGSKGVDGYMGNNSHIKIGDAKMACNIVKIIKPIGYSSSLSNNMQDFSVTFMALRSDGTEVVVDNKFLKAYHPLLLINFYELHLRYNPTE